MPLRHFDAAQMLAVACVRHRVNLAGLVAETALWAHPETHFRQLRERGVAAVFPGIRRLRPGRGERRGVANGNGLDDNSYANGLIKRSLGLNRGEVIGLECCHVWPNSCYDTRYHTVIANLVLVPAALAALTDHDAEVQAALQYRAFELYRWYPFEQPVPVEPRFHPLNWRDPEPDQSTAPRPLSQTSGEPCVLPLREDEQVAEAAVSIEKLQLWAQRPHQNVYQIIALMYEGPHAARRACQKIEALRITRNAYGAVASLMTNKGNAYGRVFAERAEKLRIHADIEDVTVRLWGRSNAARG